MTNRKPLLLLVSPVAALLGGGQAACTTETKAVVPANPLTTSSATYTPPPAAAAPHDLLDPGAGKLWHGAFVPAAPAALASEIAGFEAAAGRRLGAGLCYVGWQVGAWDEAAQTIRVWDQLGIKSHLCWEPRPAAGSTGAMLDRIVAGQEDAVIDDFAHKAKAYGKPFFLRFAHEMNGNWYPWSGAENSQNPQKYQMAWQYVWSRFQTLGATNAVWVWCPNVDSVPSANWNDLNNYYPGDAYVDWVGLDFYGLKWGNQPPGPALDKVCLTYGLRKPIMIGETACADCANYAPGTSLTKDTWTQQLFTEMAARPSVKAVFWFNINKEADWRITSCPATAQQAYRQGVADSRFVTR